MQRTVIAPIAAKNSDGRYLDKYLLWFGVFAVSPPPGCKYAKIGLVLTGWLSAVCVFLTFFGRLEAVVRGCRSMFSALPELCFSRLEAILQRAWSYVSGVVMAVFGPGGGQKRISCLLFGPEMLHSFQA
jgi:hypothetical protein